MIEKTPKIKHDGISTYQKIIGGSGITNMEKKFLYDINPDYLWNYGIVRRLEPGSYILYGDGTPNTDQVCIPSKDLTTTIYYGTDHQTFGLGSGDFMVYPSPSCIILVARQPMDLFILEYSTDCSVDMSESEDHCVLKTEKITMVMKQFNLIKIPDSDSWFPEPLSNL